MNDKQPYEKHLREKLQQLAPPGHEDESWPQMKRMLDQHLPEEKDRPGGGWWLLLLVGIILLSGTWILTRKPTGSPDVAGKGAIAQNQSEPGKQKESGVNAGKSGNASPAGGRSGTTPPDGSSPSPDQPAAGNPSLQAASAPAATAGKVSPTVSVGPTGIGSAGSAGRVQSSIVKPSSSSLIDNTVTPNHTHNSGIATGRTKSNTGRTIGKNGKVIPPASRPESDNPFSGADRIADADLYYSNIPGIRGSTDRLDYSLNFGRLDEDNLLALSPSPVDKMQIRRWIRFGVKEKKAENSPRIVGSGTSKEYVFGLSLPLAFPLADQKAVGYNFNAGPNTVTDYLPTAHFQYHFNDWSYLQTEVQFISPQYIQPVLLSSERVDLPAGSSYQYVTHNVYARKLYYFNLPVGVHYSPFRHFYLGTGLQFSTLLSGIAQFNDMAYSGGNGTLLREDYRRFHNDSLSSKLSNSEFRLMLDANYYWNRFTVGFRYNQALSNYVDIQVAPGAGYEQDKNKSLQFYLRYNLWELKKEEEVANAGYRLNSWSIYDFLNSE